MVRSFIVSINSYYSNIYWPNKSLQTLIFKFKLIYSNEDSRIKITFAPIRYWIADLLLFQIKLKNHRLNFLHKVQHDSKIKHTIQREIF